MDIILDIIRVVGTVSGCLLVWACVSMLIGLTWMFLVNTARKGE
jgi:hypothetical protein